MWPTVPTPFIPAHSPRSHRSAWQARQTLSAALDAERLTTPPPRGSPAAPSGASDQQPSGRGGRPEAKIGYLPRRRLEGDPSREVRQGLRGAKPSLRHYGRRRLQLPPELPPTVVGRHEGSVGVESPFDHHRLPAERSGDLVDSLRVAAVREERH